METPRSIHDSHFADLAASRPGTAAQAFPLVIWEDHYDSHACSSAFRHCDFFSLYFVRQGRGCHVIDEIPYAVARGDVYAMGVGQARWFFDCDDLVTDTLHFAPDVFDPATLNILAETPGFQSLFVLEPLHRELHGSRWLHLTPNRYSFISAALAELHTEWAAGTHDGTLLTHVLFLRLLVHLAREYAAQGPAPGQSLLDHEPTIAAAVHYLDTHFHEPLRISAVAARVFLSPDRFTEVFTASMGRTPRDYLGYLRLEHAKSLLQTTADSISEIGFQSGYGDAAYFTRAFRAATGLTPRDYRRKSH